MPRHEHLVLCGGLSEPGAARGTPLNLNLHGRSPNVHLRIADISKRLVANIPEVLVDLIEIAGYVYAADSAITRGGKIGAQLGAKWRRKIRLRIPVRVPALWASNSVLAALIETLSFLSEDEYEFEFQALSEAPHGDQYFEFSEADPKGFAPDQIVLFSGGLDSFAGATEQLAAGRKVALVSHRSSSKISAAQKYLVDRLKTRFGKDRILHIPVLATLNEGVANERTHRARSFLFAALGAVTARLFDLDQIYFYENGVVSLNLPPLAQVVGARATRTTHPQTINGFRRLFAEVLGRSFSVDNPFIWFTKAEIVEKIVANGCHDLIRDTRSCAHVHDMTKLNSHCGRCSQCLDRRFAVLAACQDIEDPAEAYGVDLFRGSREPGPDREMALSFVRNASAVQKMTDMAFFEHFGEASRVVKCFPEPVDTIASRILDLHQRHANAVCGVFDSAISSSASELRAGTLPADCLLSLIIGQRGGERAYPAEDEVAEPPNRLRLEIRMAIDDKNGRVVFERWGELKGVGARLLTALAEQFRGDVKNERAPERFTFKSHKVLVAQLGCESDETLRKQIHRCRNQINGLALKAGDQPPLIDAVVENHAWHGYRLNPDNVRLIGLSDLTTPKRSEGT